MLVASILPFGHPPPAAALYSLQHARSAVSLSAFKPAGRRSVRHVSRTQQLRCQIKASAADKLEVFSPSKVNLFLRVVRRREDGFHDLASLFHVIDLGDRMTFAVRKGASEDTLSCNMEGVPTDSSNLVVKALDLFRRKTGSNVFFDVDLQKEVPHGAGLGGGSGNAATALWAANSLTDRPASNAQLLEWSGDIGSDISVFFSQGAAYCTGRGEIVENTPPPLGLDVPLLLVKPPVGLATPDIFKALDLERRSSADPRQLLASMATDGMSPDLCVNDLEQPAFDILPELRQLKERLIAESDSRFSAVFMTGSGSTIVCVGSHEPPAFLQEPQYAELFVRPARLIARNSDKECCQARCIMQGSLGRTQSLAHQQRTVTAGHLQASLHAATPHSDAVQRLARQLKQQVVGVAVRREATSGLTARRVQPLAARAAAETETPSILVAEPLGDAGLDLLRAFGNVTAKDTMTPEELKSSIGQYDALIIRSASKVTREVFEAAGGRLKVVGRAGVGVDNVDLAAATEYGCLVVNAPTANTIAAAEHGIALLCALSRNVAQADKSVKEGKWERKKYVGVSLVEKTLAIIGFGKVGAEVARRARGLGLEVIAYDPYASEEKARSLGVTLLSLDECLAKAEFFSLHMPLTPQTKNLFSDEVFGKIKKGARIINVARGGVIDDAALARALDAGQVAQAALDVFVTEPPPADHPLVGRPDVICTPHLGASTAEAQEDVSVEVAEVVVSALKGEMAATAVNAPMMPPEVLAELQPYVALAAGLGRTAVQMVSESGFADINITYHSPRGDDLDTRLLRAMVIKGILEQVTTATVNLVNADLLAKNRGLRITETTVPSSGSDVLSSLTVTLGTSSARFSAAVDSSNKISVSGAVRGSQPFLSKVGNFEVDVTLEGYVLLIRQQDKPGIIASVSAILGREGVNISYMSVARSDRGGDAFMAIGVDSRPKSAIKNEIASIDGVRESQLFSDLPLSATEGALRAKA